MSRLPAAPERNPAIPLQVLLLEDQPEDAEVIVRELRREGLAFHAQRVDTRTEFVRALAEVPLDLVIADYRLPAFDGRSALEIVQRSRPDLPLIVFSGTIGEDDAVEMIKLGAADYVLKDRPARLGAAVRRALTDAAERRAHREAAARFRALIENFSDAVLLLEPDGVIRYASPAVAMGGYEPSDLVGRPFIELTHPDERAAVQRAWTQTVARTGGRAVHERRYRRKDGNWQEVEVVLSNLLHVPEVCGVVVVVRDVSARRAADNALRESQLRFRQMADNIEEVFWLTDARDRQVLYVSPAYERIWGRPVEDLLASPSDWTFAIHPEDRARVVAASAAPGDGAYDQTYRITRPDGVVRWIHERAFPVRGADGKVYRIAGVAADVTDLRESQRLLQERYDGCEQLVAARTAQVEEKNAELQRAMQAKDAFLANMSHELRTPLNAIIGFTGTLLMRLPGPLTDEQEQQLEIVRDSAQHQLSLINDLLDLAKITSGKVVLSPEPLVCEEMVREALASVRPLAEGKGVALRDELAPALPRINTDRRALRQILLNLCNNAVKFTDRGSVTLEVAEKRDGDRRFVEFAVTDTGIGIKPEFQERMFQAFTQMDSTHREGTGLGLHLSRQLARLLRGRIGFQSEYGRGSRFWLELPVD